MTMSEQIRKLADFKPSEVASIIGCSAEYVSVIRARAKHPERHRRYYRDRYQRTKKLGGIGHTRWMAEHTMLLVLLLEAGKSFGQIATEMNISRSTVAGRVKRLRDAGVIA